MLIFILIFDIPIQHIKHNQAIHRTQSETQAQTDYLGMGNWRVSDRSDTNSEQ